MMLEFSGSFLCPGVRLPLIPVEILIGFVIGLAVGVTGVGGGVLTTPTLVLFLGLPLRQSVGTALIFSTVVRASAALAYLRRRLVSYAVLTRLLAGGVPGAIAGSIVMLRVREANLHGKVVAMVGLAVSVSAVVSLLRSWVRPVQPIGRPRWVAILGFPIGLQVAFSSAGAGALGTLVLFAFTTLAAPLVVGTDLVFGLVVSAIAGTIHLSQGNWNGLVTVKLACGWSPERCAVNGAPSCCRIALCA
jgi:uncharacterized membrane protein YfcA